MKKIITLTILLLSITFSYGQYDWTKGELILKNGDTITGDLKLPLINKGALANSHKIKYRNGEQSKITKYDYTNVDKVILKDLNNEISIYEYVKTSKSRFQLFRLIKSSIVIYSCSVL